ncbi:MAG: prephenate dehydratase [Lachnospiraceae bacterium]|nr:prephenate dehydratase [Lachnospiraceae bacterium]
MVVDLSESRKQIDAIDRQIVELFESRMKVSVQVAEYKKSIGMPVLDREREKSKLKAVGELASNDFNRHGIEELFAQIMSISRKLQYSMLKSSCGDSFAQVDAIQGENDRVVFFGARGSYSEQAMLDYFGENVASTPAATFREVMAKVKSGEADYGVLPIENTTTGGITDIYDLLTEFDNYIVGEHVVKIEHALLGLPGSTIDEIRTVYSHAQGILQCGGFLGEHPQMKTVETMSTAGCAKKVLEDGDRTQAAIASRRAGELYGLTVLAPGINDNDKNSTRFIIISNARKFEKDANKVSISFTLPHESGTLYNMLSHIMYNNLNMTKIESRPLAGRTFEYRFFVDFEGNLNDPAVINTLNGIQSEALELTIFGNYKTT